MAQVIISAEFTPLDLITLHSSLFLTSKIAKGSEETPFGAVHLLTLEKLLWGILNDSLAAALEIKASGGDPDEEDIRVLQEYTSRISLLRAPATSPNHH